MAVQQTSLNAYEKLDVTGQYMQIMQVIKPGKTYTNNEIAKLTEIGINAVCARVHELRGESKTNKKRLGRIFLEYAGNRKCKVTGLNVMSWRRCN